MSQKQAIDAGGAVATRSAYQEIGSHVAADGVLQER